MQFLNESHGYAAGSVQSVGTVCLLETTDGGKTWSTTLVDDGDGLMPLAIAVAPPSIVIGCLFGDYVSHDMGKTFVSDSHALMGQWLESRNGYFYDVGQSTFGGTNGVAVSADGADTFKDFNVSVLNTEARYGAFPSLKSWFISAGEWPRSNDDDTPSDDDGPHSLRGSGKPTGSWKAQIAHSTDGGNTWVSSLYEEDKFYFNGIDCEDDTHCCAVGESDQTSPSNGVRIWCTDDGQTWTRTYFQAPPQSNDAYSLMMIQSLGDGEWMAGGTFNNAAFLHSTDGGKSWTLEQPSGALAAVIAMSVPSPHIGYALGVNQDNSMTLLKYTA
eukprot:TRINITY_DN56705_c0_g1_i1.p1 TRINITY_DN56705_c0_g1~~TRINITY_DN56705_c0_g1_i1.p1  ORF type:complete len:368 (-),score=74.60 TRINITY_DN56705_c0_g1_i1:280-1266(-)